MQNNLLLLKASSLKKILEEFKKPKHTSLSHVLFRDVVIN